MDTQELEKELHVSRYIIAYKLISGFLEIVLGFALILFGKQVYEIYVNYKIKELLEDPHDLVVSVLQKIVPYILEHQGYIVLILFLLGIVKMAGAIGLLYHKHWGLDLLVGLTVLLLPFEGFNMISDPTLTQFSYFSINLLIAFYLVNFNPKKYFHNLKHRVKKS